MWISEQLSRREDSHEPGISTGRLTIAGEAPAVMLRGERRDVQTLLPAGISWAPKAGDEVMVLRSDEGEQFLLGLCGGETAAPGELILKSGGGTLRLGSGGISIEGEVELRGRLSVNGCDILAAIEELRSSI